MYLVEPSGIGGLRGLEHGAGSRTDERAKLDVLRDAPQVPGHEGADLQQGHRQRRPGLQNQREPRGVVQRPAGRGRAGLQERLRNVVASQDRDEILFSKARVLQGGLDHALVVVHQQQR